MIDIAVKLFTAGKVEPCWKGLTLHQWFLINANWQMEPFPHESVLMVLHERISQECLCLFWLIISITELLLHLWESVENKCIISGMLSVSVCGNYINVIYFTVTALFSLSWCTRRLLTLMLSVIDPAPERDKSPDPGRDSVSPGPDMDWTRMRVPLHSPPLDRPVALVRVRTEPVQLKDEGIRCSGSSYCFVFQYLTFRTQRNPKTGTRQCSNRYTRYLVGLGICFRAPRDHFACFRHRSVTICMSWMLRHTVLSLHHCAQSPLRKTLIAPPTFSLRTLTFRGNQKVPDGGRSPLSGSTNPDLSQILELRCQTIPHKRIFDLGESIWIVFT